MIVLIATDFFGDTAASRGARQNVHALLNAGHLVTVITDSCENNGLSNLRKRFKNQLDLVLIRSINLPVLYLVGMELSFAFQTYTILKKINEKNAIELIISQVYSV